MLSKEKKLSREKSYLDRKSYLVCSDKRKKCSSEVRKVIEVISSDGLWRFACGDVSLLTNDRLSTFWQIMDYLANYGLIKGINIIVD